MRWAASPRGPPSLDGSEFRRKQAPGIPGNQRAAPPVSPNPSSLPPLLYIIRPPLPPVLHQHRLHSISCPVSVLTATRKTKLRIEFDPILNLKPNGGCSEGVVDGGDERGRGGGAQGPGGALPLELRAAVHPPRRQGQRRRSIAGQEAARGGGGGAEESGERRGGAEDGHVPQLLGSQLVYVAARCWEY
uniref:Uncharacterized protein n=1 Tax=Oryza brachyantha TaxID=4533 RepID=J3M1R6_ORYBR